MTTDFYTADPMATRSRGQGFREFFATLLRPPAVQQPELEFELTEVRTDAPIALAAKGEAFDFYVRPTFTWRAEDMVRTRFEELVDAYTPDALQALRDRAERLARAFEPHRSQDLEHEINRLLAARNWALGPKHERITCQPEVFVLPDRRVREAMQPYWRQRIEMQTEHELAMRRAELTRERTQAWSRAMAALETDSRNRHAAALVGHEAFATAFTAMTQGRKDELLKLIDLLEKAGHGFNGLGLYEYAEGLDAALAEYRKRAAMDETG
ncbi:hypothetical protein Dvina_02025 [Dactylosporangium vinaceum]|uniref:Uncharacterized protein n=1 Tax=Dactylosporangium vinaceum TaxID=53362 RepID=A0ABV5MF31_9ACTN|nr:hypothetical protein [Dactylosporangium vinaceum]UAB97014.1 hypothetical protein Dvina_02025 [Dactylosporangium vinaceum]